MWTKQEQALHTNVLELLGAKLGLLTFFKDNKNIKYIRTMMGNNTAVLQWCCARDLFGSQIPVTTGGFKLRISCIQSRYLTQLWISTAHIPRYEYVIADKNSKMFELFSGWKLTEGLLKEIVSIFGKLDTDLFASRINHQLSSYICWGPDRGAKAVDEFYITWSTTHNY